MWQAEKREKEKEIKKEGERKEGREEKEREKEEKKKETDQWNRIRSLEINPHIYKYMTGDNNWDNVKLNSFA